MIAETPPLREPVARVSGTHLQHICRESGFTGGQVRATIDLLEEGATVPFIARYRKERTGSLDEVAVTLIRDRLEQLKALDKRREAIRESLQERNLLSDELAEKINVAETLAILEDVYLPFRPKRRTRAAIAREKGLEPLANALFLQEPNLDPNEAARPFLDPEKGLTLPEDALAGARDIIAEMASEDGPVRQSLRQLFLREGVISSKLVKGKETEGQKFKDYFDWKEPVAKVPSHRFLAMLRGENEGFLKTAIGIPKEKAMQSLSQRFLKRTNPAAGQVRIALEDSFQRLLAPSLENEVRGDTKERADTEAIHVFSQNLRELMMAAPLGQKAVLAIDPGFRTGCKVVCLDAQGKLLHHTVIFPGQSERQGAEASKVLNDLTKRFHIEAIAIGNGTAGRETESFVRQALPGAAFPIILVNESGASIYSASEAAREEFPHEDITVRGAVSIGRRLMDPLAELVKLDPKSIGVGQYQHDVDQGKLKTSLDDTVSSCVNAVGVEVNTASQQLLTYVSGLGPQLAKNIVSFRNEHGPFRRREDLKKVTRLGPKAFEQAAGFLRIRNSENPLDASAVHPERYAMVRKMAADLGCDIPALMKNEALRKSISLKNYVTETLGMPTLTDIMSELTKPGRDPREQFETFAFAAGIEKIDDLQPGQRLPGIVTNVTKFGAFVDIGVHQDGLVHISEMADRFVRDPAEIVKVHQKVQVTVVSVDPGRKRIALSLKSRPNLRQTSETENKN